MNKKELIYRYFAEKKFARFLMSIISFLVRIFTVKEIDPKILENIEGIVEMNIPILTFDTQEVGITGILRTKNGGKFLEEVIKSCINCFDEIVIINNNSTDNAKIVSEKLMKQYSKIKYFEYNYDIIRDKEGVSNSIHSLAYYYNWSFSKASYSIVCKLDDDGLFISELIKRQIQKIKRTNSIFKNFLYYYYWGLNIYKNDGSFGVLCSSPFSGKYGDIGFYRKSRKTYYIQDGYTERFVSNKFYYDIGFSYLHLKYFKEENGLKYAPKHLKDYFNNLLCKSELIPISRYTQSITDETCKSLIEKALTNKD